MITMPEEGNMLKALVINSVNNHITRSILKASQSNFPSKNLMSFCSFYMQISKIQLFCSNFEVVQIQQINFSQIMKDSFGITTYKSIKNQIKSNQIKIGHRLLQHHISSDHFLTKSFLLNPRTKKSYCLECRLSGGNTSEVVLRSCSVKNIFLKTSQHSEKNTCNGVFVQ